MVFLEHDALFRRNGWDTAMMAMHHPKNDPSPWSEYFVDEIEFGHSYSPLAKAKMASKVIYSFEAQRKLGTLLDRFPANVAHIHCIYHHLSPSVLPLLKKRGVPTVLTAHDLKIACPAYKMLNSGGVCERCKGGNVLNVALHRCIHNSAGISSLIAIESAVHHLLGVYKRNLDRVVVPSRFYGEKLAEWGWPREKLVHIPNYVHAESYKPDFTAGEAFVYFGRLAPEKGLRTLIAAAMNSGIQLRIAGTGPIEQDLHRLAGDAPNIEFLGYQSGDALWDLIRSARAVVLPSEWYENAPMSVLESYALGKPVIGADIGGIPELVQPGSTGALFPSGDTDALTDTLLRYRDLPDPAVTEQGKAARECVANHYTIERYFEQMSALYQELVSRKAA
ncbi:MAG: glycosyltransferase family 4 protein [Gammaproteobacteria bacterium]|nr:glycosyltransferase family 4 protein [Gammaproteobacteria bacterium]